mmetsp:Transcript_42614/g.72681  ORF Transcript_42614/g.72681 Transcript_42614/m.72681 type:complete len:250 (-) Transcript_42614:39-788(-)
MLYCISECTPSSFSTQHKRQNSTVISVVSYSLILASHLHYLHPPLFASCFFEQLHFLMLRQHHFSHPCYPPLALTTIASSYQHYHSPSYSMTPTCPEFYPVPYAGDRLSSVPDPTPVNARPCNEECQWPTPRRLQPPHADMVLFSTLLIVHHRFHRHWDDSFFYSTTRWFWMCWSDVLGFARNCHRLSTVARTEREQILFPSANLAFCVAGRGKDYFSLLGSPWYGLLDYPRRNGIRTTAMILILNIGM